MAMEAHRRNMPYCMGSLFWQHNDCWPVASWASRDFYGRWKAQHYFAKKAYQNVIVSPIAENGKLEVFIVSDLMKTVKGVLNVKVVDLHGNIVFQLQKNVTVEPNQSKVHFSENVENILKGKKNNEVVVNAIFIDDSQKIKADNNYFFTRYKEIDFPKTVIDKNVTPTEDGFNVTLNSSKFARGVFLSIQGIDNFFADNYFDILPNETVTVHVTTKLTKDEFEKQLKIVSISDAY
jgi:beta-mannosidase